MLPPPVGVLSALHDRLACPHSDSDGLQHPQPTGRQSSADRRTGTHTPSGPSQHGHGCQGQSGAEGTDTEHLWVCPRFHARSALPNTVPPKGREWEVLPPNDLGTRWIKPTGFSAAGAVRGEPRGAHGAARAVYGPASHRRQRQACHAEALSSVDAAAAVTQLRGSGTEQWLLSPHHVGLPPGCVGVLVTRQPASPRARDPRESTRQQPTRSLVIWPWKWHDILLQRAAGHPRHGGTQGGPEFIPRPGSWA